MGKALEGTGGLYVKRDRVSFASSWRADPGEGVEKQMWREEEEVGLLTQTEMKRRA